MRKTFELLLLLAIALGASAPASANVYVVSNVNDTGAGSLRKAISDANANPGADTITFMIAGSTTIKPLSALPSITGPLEINGHSQLGAGGALKIELDGTSAGASTAGLSVVAGPTQIHGLVINRFGGRGIYVANASSVQIQGNYIGTDATGSVALGNGQEGVLLSGTASAIVGGDTPQKANVISGNGAGGVSVFDGGLAQVKGNRIGTNAAGTAALGNAGAGVRVLAGLNFVTDNLVSGNARGIVLDGAENVVRGNAVGVDAGRTAAIPNTGEGVLVIGSDNTIGGSSAAMRNVISGNGGTGVSVSASADATVVVGNYVGTNGAGTAAIANGGTGVRVLASGATIGTGQPGEGNLVSGNTTGISIEGTGCSVFGNSIGLDASGTNAIPNQVGIAVSGSGNAIGQTGGKGNVVSGNAKRGISLGKNASSNTIAGNLVGTNAAGTAALDGKQAGILVDGVGNAVGENLVSGNTRGIYVTGSGNVVQSNLVGTTADGNAKLPNSAEGIFVTAAPNTLVGGPGVGNRVAANGSSGIFVLGSTSAGTIVQGNAVGVGAAGAALGNYQAGIALTDAVDVTVGGTGAGEGNVVANNGWVGIDVFGGTGNSILGNSIFENAAAGIELQDPYGPSVNDPGDGDFGANDLQNFPVLTSGLALANATHVEGFLASAPLDAYRVEIFASAACDATGLGEGKTFLGALEVLSDGMGKATVSGDVAQTNLAYLTATATSSSGDTSEFSPCVLTTGPNPGKVQFGMTSFLAYEELGHVTITVTRSEGSAGAVSVHYATANDTAAAPGDFTATSGTLDFAEGEVMKTFDVPLQLDAGGEGTENFKVVLSSPTGGLGLGAHSVADVNLFDYSQSFPGTFVTGGSITEGDSGTKNLSFSVKVTPTNIPVNVKLHTVDGTAKAGSDYDAQTFDLTFQPGDAPKTIGVPIHGDTAIEGNETFYVEVTQLSAGYVSGQGVGVILEDDAPAMPLCVGGADIAAPKIVISGLGDAPGNEKIAFSGKLLFPAGTPAGTTPLDMLSRGAQVRVEDLGTGQTLLDVTKDTTPVPAGAAGEVCTAGLVDGWTADAGATTYLYLNRSGAVPPSCSAGSALGLKRVRLADQRAGNGFIKLNGRAARTVTPPTGAVRLTVVLGADAAAGLSGACAQHTLPALQCAMNAYGTRMVCK